MTFIPISEIGVRSLQHPYALLSVAELHIPARNYDEIRDDLYILDKDGLEIPKHLRLPVFDDNYRLLAVYLPTKGEFFYPDERIPYTNEEISQVEIGKPHQLAEVYFQTNEGCNLSCPGCATGSDVVRRPKSMSVDSMKQAIAGIARSATALGFSEVKIKYGGGEPTIVFNRILEIQEHIAEIEKHFPQLKFHQVLITNGTLLDKVVPRMVRNMTRAQLDSWHISVSIWGLEDRNTQLRKGKDYWTNLKEGLRLLGDHNISHSINHVIQPSNAGEFGDFLRAAYDPDSDKFLGRLGQDTFTDQPFTVSTNLFRPSIPFDESQELEIIRGIMAGIREMMKLVEEGKWFPFSGKLDYFDPFQVKRVCGVGHNYLAIGAGTDEQSYRVQPCHEKLPGASNDILTGNLFEKAFGSIPDIEGLEPNNIAAPDEEWSATTTTLMLHGATGCPHIRQKVHGNVRRAAYPYNIMMRILPSWLELIIKYHDRFIRKN